MDEQKTFAMVGTVTIGTDEYRNLIEETVKAKLHITQLQLELDETNIQYRQAIISRDEALRSGEQWDELTTALNVALADKKALDAVLRREKELLNQFLEDNDLWGKFVEWKDERGIDNG